MSRRQKPIPRGLPLRLVALEDRTLPAGGVSATLTNNVLRVTDWQPSDTLIVRQSATNVTLEANGQQAQTFLAVRQIFLDVQYDARVTNNTSGPGAATGRPVYLSRRDPTGKTFVQTGTLAAGATSLPPTPTPPPAPADWFDAAFSDAGFRTLARSLTTDGTVSRADFFQLFAQVKTDGTVSAAEFTDLGDLLHTERVTSTLTPRYTMTDAVRGLALEVVDGDPANATFQGAPLGNLAAGSTAAHLDKLVSKWFLGADRPRASSSSTYRYVNGSLFVNGPAYTDVRQGGVGDCYLVAALAEIAQGSPQRIVDMFTDNGDGTFTVRFYQDGTPQYVTVDRYLPTDSAGRPVYATFGTNYISTANELWVALVEKAYAQINQSGWLGRAAANAYDAIASGYSDLVMKQVTGLGAGWTGITWSTADQLIAAANSGRATVFGSLASNPGNGVMASHGYGLVSYNATTGKYTLFNPWGSTVDLTYAQLRQSFYGFWQAVA